jgi:hypothetical protein
LPGSGRPWRLKHWTIRHAQRQRNAFSDRRHLGLHSLVRGLPAELPAPRANDGRARCAIDQIDGSQDATITARQTKYINNIVEQDHRAIKRVTRPMLSFKSLRSASNVLAGVELMRMIRKDQFAIDDTSELRKMDGGLSCLSLRF